MKLFKWANKKADTQKVIYKMFYEHIYRIALYMTKDKHLAQDVVQETFYKAFKNLHTLKDEKKIEGWLSIIANRTAIDILKKEKKYIPADDDETMIFDINNLEKIDSIETIVEAKFLVLLMRKQIQNLDPIFKEILYLNYELELTEQEISDSLNISKGTVKSRLFRAKAKLKDKLLVELNSKEEGETVAEK